MHTHTHHYGTPAYSRYMASSSSFFDRRRRVACSLMRASMLAASLPAAWYATAGSGRFGMGICDGLLRNCSTAGALCFPAAGRGGV